MDTHLTPDYLNARLTEILQALNDDIEKNVVKHKNEVLLLHEIIKAKDKEIKQLTQEVESYRRMAKESNKNKDNHTSSFKRITLGKKTPKNISQFNSESFSTNGKITQSVLLDHKEDNNKIPIPKLETSKSTKNMKTFISPRLPKSPQIGQKQNLIQSVKKLSIDQGTKKIERSITNKPPLSKLQNSNTKAKTGKKSVSKDKTDRQKKCINIVIPTTNFCAYSINASKGSRKQSTTKLW